MYKENVTGMTEERYKRNIPAITETDQKKLKDKTVAVAGCGGLGGFVIEALARLGIGKLKLIDADCFSESNLNRQLYAAEGNLGEGKADAAQKRIRLINSEIRTEAIAEMITKQNAEEILSGCDLCIDALDNIEGRLVLEDVCSRLGIYLIHGAIEGWNAQISCIAPKDGTLKKIYGQIDAEQRAAAENDPVPSVLSFTAEFAAGLEAAEAIKVLTGCGEKLESRLLIADLKTADFEIITI